MQHVLGGTIYKQTRKIMESNNEKEQSPPEVSKEIQFTWTETPQPLKEIIDSSGDLPSVVKMWQEKPSSDSSPLLDIHKPLLLYKELNGVKVYCKNVTSVDLLTGAQCKDDPIVVIPLGYAGWFRLIDDRDKPLTTISNVARIMPKKILSYKQVTGYIRDQYTTNSNLAEPLHLKVDIQPGLLKVLNVKEDFVRYTDHKKIVKRKLLRCLVCKTEDDTNVLLPFEVAGMFYLIEVRKSTSKHINIENIGYAYNIKDMYTAGLSKGVILKLLHGRPPSKPCGFSQILKVCDLIKDHTVIACTISENKRLLELPVAPVPLFVKALNYPHFDRHQTFLDTLKFMDKNADGYANELKVRHNYKVDKTARKEEKESKKDEKQ
ncbi:Hypothetical predicted protein [Mytilus galloprovincialis]|uniref:CABIT domain-containing protein n=2 Tax=Mytilus galloprovincialis TaxID=29158 RepID=A0A8B6F5L5_MYTGA|nr:Hypothetical predicted protein [Mytilus galloprovincialis]